MKSYLWLCDKPRFASIFEENLSRDMGMSGSNLKKPARVPARIIRPQGRDSAKHSNAFSAITDKITKQISQDLTSSSTASHGESLNITFAQSIKDGMKELKDGMTNMAQYQMETAKYQAMASAPSPMRNKFYSAYTTMLWIQCLSKSRREPRKSKRWPLQRDGLHWKTPN